jgi:anti-sigma-K factor RskA
MVSLVLILVLGASNLFLWGRLNTLESRQRASLRAVLLEGTAAAPNGTGLLVISLDGTHGTLVVDRLPVLSESQQYQLWLTRDGQRTSGGVFSVDEKGYKGMYIKSPEPLDSYTGVGITIEPAGGSPGPTGEKVLGGSLLLNN